MMMYDCLLYTSDQDAVQHGVDDGLAAHLLCQLVGSVGGDVALQGLVVLEHLKKDVYKRQAHP